MIDLYAWGTTNGLRALIMAEEAGLPFTLHQIDIHKGDQKTAAYEKGTSNNNVFAARL
jgi:GST-like protein